jgi:hypothetical protein
VADKYQSYNFLIDNKSDLESIKITYFTGPGIEFVKKEFEKNLPAENELKFKLSTTNMDLIEMALDKFRGIKLSEFT